MSTPANFNNQKPSINPAYQLLIESYMKAQEVVNNNEMLDSQRK